MNKKDKGRGFSTSPKEKELLKRRLETLFKEHELKNQSSRNEQKPAEKQQKHNLKNKLKKDNDVGNVQKQQKKEPNRQPAGGMSEEKRAAQTSYRTNEKEFEKNRAPKKAKNSNKKKKEKSIKDPQGTKHTQTQSKTENKDTAPLPNAAQKLSRNQRKKAKKRSAAEAVANDSKKPKIVEEKPKYVNAKANKSKKSSKNGKASNNEWKSSRMSGFVKGRDFDSDSSDYICKHRSEMAPPNRFSKSSKYEHTMPDIDEGDTYPYVYGDLMDDKKNEDCNGDDSYDCSDIDESDYDFSDLSEGEEEEYDYEHYSDFDEDDYEGEEEEDDHEYDFTGEEEDDDDDYKLPENIPEDLIIHSGTATKRDLQPEDNVQFKDKKYCQIIELKEEKMVKIINQPEAYKKEELLKLKHHENLTLKIAKVNETAATKEEMSDEDNDEDDCPKLVPIVDEDGFQLYNPDEDDDDDDDEDEELYHEEQEMSYDENDNDMDNISLGSEYTELNSDDAESFMSDDINDKYLKRNTMDDDYYSSEDDHEANLNTLQSADIIKATDCVYVGGNEHLRQDTSDDGLQDTDINQLPSQQLCNRIKVGSDASILSTTIVEPQELSNEDNKENILPGKELNESLTEESVESCSPVATEEQQENINSKEGVPEEQASPVVEVKTITPTKQSVNRNQQNLTDYNTLFCNSINATLVLVLLKDPFYVYGTVRLTLLAGSVEVYGHPLALNNEVEIFSPRGCSVIEISSKSSENGKATASTQESLKRTLQQYESNFILADLQRIVSGFEAGKDAVVLMKRNEERKKVVQQFKKFMSENIFPNLQNTNMDKPLYSSEYLLRCVLNTSTTEQKSLRLPDQWEKLAITDTSRVMLAGGKGVGKSTLLRYLINRHLPRHERMLLIDLDIGQPEIFMPQTVSCTVVRKPLLGPGFFLNVQPEKAFAVGHTNIVLCPHKYLKAVLDLIRYCLLREDFKGIPWLVNTMGYNKGFGLELISVIATSLPLTDVVQLQSNKEINNFENILYPQTLSQIPRTMFGGIVEDDSHPLSYRLHVWQSAIAQESRYQKEWYMSPKDVRYAMLLARLSQALHGHADWLTDCKPLSAPLDQLRLINLMDNIPPSSKDELARAMEANLVYLCHYDNDQSSVECLGIGVVRAIDYHVRQVYLLPAMPVTRLKHVNCLALGDMPLPNSIFTNQGSRVQKTAPFVYNTIEANASKAIKQIYHRPKAFLSGKRKSLN